MSGFRLLGAVASVALCVAVAAGGAGAQDYIYRYKWTSGGSAPVSAPLAMTPPVLSAYTGESVTAPTPASASGGTAPYTWSLSGAPGWLSVNASTGALSGTPQVSDVGSHTFSIVLGDSVGGQVTQSVTVTVAQRLALAAPVVEAILGAPITVKTAAVASGGTAPYNWTLLPTKPAWLSVGAADGVLTGTPDALGTFNATLRITDTASEEASAPFQIDVKESGLYAWGNNFYYNLGDSTTTARSSPVAIAANVSKGWTVLASSPQGSSTCGINGGALYCWGRNDSTNILVPLPMGNVQTPTRVGTQSDWTAVGQGSGHGCGIRSGQMWCWSNVAPTGARVGSDSDWVHVSAAQNNACGIRAGGSLWCWGRGGTPAQIAGSWRRVDMGHSHNCGIQTSGEAWCWGDNANRQLGNAATGASSASPVVVDGGHTDWTEISAGYYHSCGIRSGILYCWGNDVTYGVIGTGAGTMQTYPSPALVTGGYTGWTAVTTGLAQTCGITSGRMYCWGSNENGWLGAGFGGTRTNIPQRVGTASNWKGLTSGGQFTIGMLLN